MPQNKPTEDLKREALTVLKQWRAADKEAIADPSLKRVEYKCRNNLRTAADNLTEAHHG